MTQVIEFTKLPAGAVHRATWLGRLRAKLFGSDAPQSVIPLERSSPHMLRDIGLWGDQRANHLLRDDRLFRR